MSLEGTYTRHPFVSEDGADNRGIRAEVKVITGFGYVSKAIEESEKSLKVNFDVANVDTKKYPVYGRLRIKEDSKEAVELVKRAKEENFPIFFRIEIVRKDKIDRTTPISELTQKDVASESVYRQLTGVSTDENDESAWKWGARYTNPKEDKYYNPNGQHSAADMTEEEITQYHAKKNGSIPEAPAPSYSTSSQSVDPSPHIARKRDGRVNLSGYGVNIPFNILAFIMQQARDNNVNAEIDWFKHIAERLFGMTNTIQLKAYEGELLEADPSLASHTKIRSIVFEVIRSLAPIQQELVEGGKEAEDKWLRNIYKESLGMWNWSLGVSGFLDNEK